MPDGNLRRLVHEGVSPWLNGFHRGLLRSGRLVDLVTRGLRGVTTRPDLLAAALAGDASYQGQLARLAARGSAVDEALRALRDLDVRLACDGLAATYRATGHREGLVSVDLDPRLAHDAAATVAEAVRVRAAVARPNALVKVPATAAGLAAIRECTGRGIGVHVTEIYGVGRYREVVDAYLTGLERARRAGRPLGDITSVASFPVHRIQAEVDALLGASNAPLAGDLRGEAALAVARVLYGAYDEELGGARWSALAAAGARPQRLMWTVDGPYAPEQARYAARLVGWHTAVALPVRALAAADRGERPRGDTLDGRLDAGLGVLDAVLRTGLRCESVARTLAEHGEKHRVRAWEALRAAVALRLRAPAGGR
ncbi:transaldolase family protein [Streptomyces echinoruber]|jgi:transaldolase|uniref:Transaldolase n=1 Tax=Streptomyces echinoruber TaxID=68898 RepID=A0A918RHD0_9ACTN|nr:transaldolase family protein [Streptomyces echinoruber]GGZ97868.1 transaldolase 1 [Streptomyces echinoruber]